MRLNGTGGYFIMRAQHISLIPSASAINCYDLYLQFCGFVYEVVQHSVKTTCLFLYLIAAASFLIILQSWKGV